MLRHVHPFDLTLDSAFHRHEELLLLPRFWRNNRKVGATNPSPPLSSNSPSCVDLIVIRTSSIPFLGDKAEDLIRIFDESSRQEH